MKQTKMLRSPFALLALSLVCCGATLVYSQTLPAETSPAQTSPAQTAPAQTPPAQAPPAPQLSTRDAATQQASAVAATFDQVVDRAVEREHFFMAQMKQLHPLVETYLQNLREDKDLNAPVPVSDVYFLGRLDMSEGTDDRAFTSPTTAGLGKRMLSKLSNAYSMKFLPLGFAQMAVLDQDFQRRYYDFTFVRREFLGELRCVVMDVAPKKDAGKGRFLGRIWIEDQDYNLKDLRRNSEFTEITVDAPQAVQDQSQKAQDASPIEAQRAWERQAEINVIDRLQQIGLVAPEGEIDKVLMTVVNNVMVTNNLDIQPEVHCRVLLTTPLESFTIGHTIVMSRGMIDVLPDEASLAMILTHELAHIVLGHHLDTKLAFNDRMFFPDERTFERMDFARDRGEEEAADKKAVELLNSSPYKDKLSNAGLFLKAVQARAPELKNLIRAHLGDSLLNGNATRMSSLMTASPQFDPKKADQVAALPLGGRVKVDPWNNQLELIKTKPVAITNAADKMPFEVTPFFPFLTRLGSATAPEKAAPAAAPVPEKTAAAPTGQ